MTKVIEFFGVSGSGKTYIKNKIKKKNHLDYRSAIYIYSHKQIKLDYFQKIILNYFKIIKSDLFKKIKLPSKQKNTNTTVNSRLSVKKNNSFFEKYKQICQKLFKKNKKKNLMFASYVLNIIKSLNCKKEFKQLVEFWFKEEFSSYYLFKTHVSKKKIVDSEGFVQRLIIYLYFSKKKNYKKILQKYLNLMPTIDKLFILNYNNPLKNKKKYSLPEKVKIKKQIEIFLFIKQFIFKNKKYKKKIKEIIEINRRSNLEKI